MRLTKTKNQKLPRKQLTQQETSMLKLLKSTMNHTCKICQRIPPKKKKNNNNNKPQKQCIIRQEINTTQEQQQPHQATENKN